VDHDSRLPPRTDRDEQVTGNLSGGDRCPNGQLGALLLDAGDEVTLHE
jgi:hypothetical protein